ncbi:helix-turn-helix transcriptional regulator [Nocardioides nanhaiensis]|uniref:HTH luxR-type domain-containing protein n=1 Tax=Nocardioides nanhaiensis TaxID=1476871 RepID=A0ABP8VQ15_9ACTN
MTIDGGGRDTCREVGAGGDVDVAATLQLAGMLARSGQVGEALAVLEALRSSQGPIDPLEHARLLALLVDCRLARGDLGDALELREELPALCRPEQAAAVAALAEHALGEIELALGAPEAALAHFRRAGDREAELSPEHRLAPDDLPWRVGAVLALVRGGGRDADHLAGAQLVAATTSGSAHAVAQALRTLATTDGGGRRLVLLREAQEALAGVPAARLAAQIATDVAGVLLLQGDPAARTEAVALLRSAETYADGEQLWPLQSRVHRLLERAGETPRRVHAEALAALTQAERRVAVPAAAGHSNRQIAGELLLSVKAVEWHLSRVYRKLGIRSRRALAEVLAPS